MDNDDTDKPRLSLATSGVAFAGPYAELYPTFGPRLIEAEQSAKPEIARRISAIHAAQVRNEGRRADHIVRTWRLTATEVRLALHLADGGSVAGYAELFGVAEGTARGQLKSVFAKVGVNRQAALVSLVPRR